VSARDVNIEINLQGNALETMQAINQEYALVTESFGDLYSEASKLDAEMKKLGGDILSAMPKSIPEYMKAGMNALGGSIKNVAFNALASLKKSFKETYSSGADLNNVLSNLAKGGIGLAITSFGKASIDAFTVLEKQQKMLQNLSGDEFPALQTAIANTIQASQGLSSEGSLLEASNQALKMGASVEFVSSTMSGFQKAAAVTGASMTEMMASAQNTIVSGRVSFFKENGAIFGQYIDQMDAINKMEVSDAHKRLLREELITEALSKNSELQNQYGSYMQTTSAMLETYNQRWGDLQENVGQLLSKGIKPLLGLATSFLNFFTDSEKGLARTQIALTILSPAIGIGLTAALWSAATAAWALVAPMAPLILAFLAVGVVLAGVLIIFEDISNWMEGGDSMIGDFLGPFADFDLGAIVQGWLDTFVGWWDGLVGWFGEAWGGFQELIKEYGMSFLYALFPVLLLPKVLDLGIELFKKGWQKMVNWLKGNSFFAPILKDLSAIKDKISNALGGFDLSGMFDGLIPYDTINWFIEKLNDIMGKLSKLSRESVLIPDFNWSPIAPLIPRKEGGPLEPGGTYLVAEPGTGGEILQMGGSGGMATPVNKLKSSSSGVQISFGNIIVQGNDSASLAQDFMRQVESALESLSPKMRMALGLPQGA
jgi:hypothetical protein